MERKNAWDKYPEGKKREEVFAFAEEYRGFISRCKTERECVTELAEKAQKAGFVDLEEIIEKGTALKAGDKVFANNMGKGLALFVMGKKSLEEGMNILGAHIDSPRMDLKQDPLYEDTDFAMLDTHYYGGIKKYQWGTIPLALHGVVVKADGSSVCVNVGEKADEPVFCVTDLLPHLAQEQMKRTPGELIKGEELNILIGSRPFRDDEASDRVKLNIMRILNEKYGICEDDFVSAELEAVPAGGARDIGFDRSMIGSYGHDDRVCAYTALTAQLSISETPEVTAVTVLTDKEETGSDGNTGLRSSYLRYFIEDIAESLGEKGRDVLSRSKCLSADVNAALDPTFPDVTEKRNCAYINYGVVVTKFTGARGKSGTSDASAEFAGEIRRLMDKNDVIWQTGELGRVDLGGGGTVAAYIANMDVDTIDVGVPVLCMHAPFEVVSKLDVYMAYKAFAAFFAE